MSRSYRTAHKQWETIGGAIMLAKIAKVLCAGALTSALLGISVVANAADMAAPVYKAPPVVAPSFSWTGFYIGGELGGAWANGNVTDSLFGLSVSSSHDGWLGGGVIGYNYQVNNLVFGIEGDFDGTSLRATGTGVFIPGVGTLQASAKTDWIGTIAGRVGFAADRALFYVKGGGGWVGNTASITNLTTGASVSASNTNDGWLIGGGLEYAFTPSWSGKLEYDYLGLNSWSWNSALFPGDTFTASRNISMFKVGINYRFGSAQY